MLSFTYIPSSIQYRGFNSWRNLSVASHLP
jgi:hypothetical protein